MTVADKKLRTSGSAWQSALPWFLGVSLFAMTIGCGESGNQDGIETTYGKVSKAKMSINGISLLAQALRDRGNTVTTKRRISPSIERYDVLIWFPNSKEAPSSEAVTAINQWFSTGYYGDRRLIYVGGHYDAEIDYFRAVAENATGEVREEALRRIAERKIQKFDSFDYFSWRTPNESCDWFSLEQITPQKSSNLTGGLVAGMNQSELPTLPYGTMLIPNDSFTTFQEYSYAPQAWDTNVILAIDDKPMVSSLSNVDYGDSEILLVSNGSFLLNFGIVDPKKEALANRLLDRLPTNSSVLILESGPSKIRVSESEFENRNAWAWLAEAPFRYIIPHFLFWGVMYCFVKFPIHGRPKKDKPSVSSFRNHIKAIARQFARAGGRNKAMAAIRQYQEIADDKPKSR